MQEIEETVVEHGDLLRTFKRECRRAFSHTLQATLENPGTTVCWGQRDTTYAYAQARTHTHKLSFALSLSHTHTQSLSFSLSLTADLKILVYEDLSY